MSTFFVDRVFYISHLLLTYLCTYLIKHPLNHDKSHKNQYPSKREDNLRISVYIKKGHQLIRSNY